MKREEEGDLTSNPETASSSGMRRGWKFFIGVRSANSSLVDSHYQVM